MTRVVNTTLFFVYLSMKRIVIGCDPAFRDNGFALAIIDIDKSVRFVKFAKPLDFLGWYLHDSPEDAEIFIENSNLQKNVFTKYFTFLIHKRITIISKLSQAASIGAKVGKNQCYSEVAYRLFNEKYKTHNISPRVKGGKLNANTLIAMCKSHNVIVESKELKGKANEDKRDALQLALRYFR